MAGASGRYAFAPRSGSLHLTRRRLPTVRRPLAVSVPVGRAIWADPKEVHDAGGISVGRPLKALTALNIPPTLPSARINVPTRKRAFYLSGAVNPDMADRPTAGAFICAQLSRRYYPVRSKRPPHRFYHNVDSQD
ncbi:hypothetical protein KCP78_24715 [Salmonella enterica subsp. enterica]|nr:hypothetical protein KCP78_24715 [Salmonella enterica subsp. enterica]